MSIYDEVHREAAHDPERFEAEADEADRLEDIRREAEADDREGRYRRR